jgi:hypothetical protein
MSEAEDAATLRRRLYAGELSRRAATPASRALAALAMAQVAELLGADPRRAHQRGVDVHGALTELQRRAARDPEWWGAMADIVRENGFDPGRQLADAPRLRALAPGLAPERAPPAAYAVHRDTWYANPACQVNWWLAIEAVDERESFALYPGYFSRAVPNDSHLLDFARARSEALAGRRTERPHAPAALEALSSEGLRFSLAAGELLLFSGAHLHAGVPVTSDRVRFSIDFRTADVDDLAEGLGPPLIDTHCRGAAVEDYIGLGPFAPGSTT